MKTKLLLTAIIVCLAGFSNAQIIHVPADQPTIQAGINAAADGDTVLVAENTYFENIRFMGKAITVASEFIMDADTNHINNTIIDGSQATDPDSASTVMFINEEDTTSVINGFTIKGGRGLISTTNSIKFGGGIACFNAGATIVNNKITDNLVTHAYYDCGGTGIGSFLSAVSNKIIIENNLIDNNHSIANSTSAFGGGIFLMNNATIKNNTIEQNTCNNTGAQADGGGIEVWQGPGPEITVYIDNNIIRNNTVDGADYGFGAGINIVDVTDITIMNNFINYNITKAGSVGYGGGIYASNSGIEINNNTIEDNSCDATTAYGGGISLYNNGKSIISNNEINENKILAENYSGGGGVYVSHSTDTLFIYENMVSNDIISGIGFGGGIAIFSTTFDVVYMERNSLTNNYASGDGGGLYTYNTYRTQYLNNIFANNEANNKGGALRFRQNLVKSEKFGMPFPETGTENELQKRDDVFHPLIANNNFISNTANQGGAISSDHGIETPVVFNSIFWGNTANTGQDIYNESSSDMQVYNNDIDTTKIYTPWTGAANIFCDPSFESDSIHLDWPSQCVNAGIESLEVDGVLYNCPTTDIDGDARPFEWTEPDIGADEAQWYYVGREETEVPDIKSKVWNYPNPFTISTIIEYELQKPSTVQITIYNRLGEQLEVIRKTQSAGRQKVLWNGEGLPGGVYFCVLKTDKETKTTKMIKLK